MDIKLSIAFLVFLTLVSCAEYEIPSHRLIENGGMYYEQGSNQPFTGTSVTFQDSFLFSKKYFQWGVMIKKETFYSSGQIHTRAVFSDGSKNPIISVFDKMGNDISNQTFLTFWDNGVIKNTGNYIDGKKHGIWEDFDISGKSVNRTYWRDNELIPIYDDKRIDTRDNIPYFPGSNTLFSGIIKFGESKYTGVTLQEFREGKPNGIYETRHLLKDGGGLACYSNGHRGLSYNFESKYIVDYVQTWDEGNFHKCYSADGQLSAQYFVVNNIDNEIIYHENGQIQTKAHMVPDSKNVPVYHKEFFEYYENGQVATEGFYDKGVLVSAKRFDASGRDISNGEGLGVETYYPYMSGLYLNGFKEGKWEQEDGSFDTYQKGIREGPTVTYLRPGCTWMVGSYKNGVKEGEWIEYNNCMEDGDSSELTYFENGEEVER